MAASHIPFSLEFAPKSHDPKGPQTFPFLLIIDAQICSKMGTYFECHPIQGPRCVRFLVFEFDSCKL